MKTVWVVDDDPVYKFLIARILKSAQGIESHLEFENGKHAYDHLLELIERKANLPEMILLDLNMPIWDGWTFLTKYNELTLDAKPDVFICSSSIDSADFAKAKHHKCVKKFYTKPLALHDISEMLHLIQSS